MGEIGPRLVEGGDGVALRRGLDPSPATCGNTNHIQWLRFRPARNSARACSTVPAWASTKRERAKGS